MINDFNTTFAQELQETINPRLKKWAGIGKTVDNGLLFRSKQKFGLGITSIFDYFQRMQLVKCELLRNSKDPSIRELFKTREIKNSNLSRIWKATNVYKVATAEVDLDIKFPSQHSNQGIGFGNFMPNPTPSQKRKLITAKAASFSEEARLAHTLSLKQQSVWLQWAEVSEPFDLSWRNLIWGSLSTHVLKFVLNATVNWVRTPALLHLWGYKQDCCCCLCGANKCTLHHILSNCNFSLNSGRYTWRHNSVLALISQSIQDYLCYINNQQQSESVNVIQFVKAGASQHTLKSKRKQRHSNGNMLSNASDWKMLVDLPGVNFVFPPEIFNTNERPDIVIWSAKLKKVLLIELTCPAEEGFTAAQIRKQSRYSPLQNEICRQTNWKTTVLTMEVGVRGFVSLTCQQVLRKLGMPHKSISRLCKHMSEISARCSYTIYLAANSQVWDANRPLLEPI